MVRNLRSSEARGRIEHGSGRRLGRDRGGGGPCTGGDRRVGEMIPGPAKGGRRRTGDRQAASPAGRRRVGMAENRLSTQIGHRVSLPGHFDVPVILEDVRALGADGSAGYECRVRLPDGTLEEAVISPAEAATVFGAE